MNIYEVSKVLKENPGLCAKNSFGSEIIFSIGKGYICYKNSAKELLLTSSTIDDEWTIQDKKVDFITAFNAWQKEDKEIYSLSECGIEKFIYGPNKNTTIMPKEIKDYKWFIKYNK